MKHWQQHRQSSGEESTAVSVAPIVSSWLQVQPYCSVRHTLPDGCARVHDVINRWRRVQRVHNASVQRRLLCQLLSTGVHSRIHRRIRNERACTSTVDTCGVYLQSTCAVRNLRQQYALMCMHCVHLMAITAANALACLGLQCELRHTDMCERMRPAICSDLNRHDYVTATSTIIVLACALCFGWLAVPGPVRQTHTGSCQYIVAALMCFYTCSTAHMLHDQSQRCDTTSYERVVQHKTDRDDICL
jgi:hypothetical protein